MVLRLFEAIESDALPSKPTVSDRFDYDTTNVNYSRWQFVVGIEIPLLTKITPLNNNQ